jgi:hypothetical protein
VKRLFEQIVLQPQPRAITIHPILIVLQRSKFVGSMTTSRMVMPRGRVSMNITT